MSDSSGQFRVLPLEEKYVDGAVEMHLIAFRDFFLAQLGRRFLKEFYRQAAGHELTVGYVAVDDSEQVVGACFGATDAGAFYKDLLRRRWWAFGLKSLGAVMKSPRIIPRLIRALRHKGDRPNCDIEPLGALLSIAANPDFQGKGVGGALMRPLCDEFVRKSVDAVYLTTDADNNDRVRGFYTAMGWELLGYYETPEKRRMCWYLWQNPEKPKVALNPVEHEGKSSALQLA